MAVTVPSPVVSLRDVMKVYGAAAPVTALRSVSLDIYRGEVVLIMGPSGSGKTTLLTVIGCMLRPSSGSVRICDREVTGLTESELPAIRRGCIGFVFQSFNLLPALTARANVEVAVELQGARRGVARQRALQLLASVGLGDRVDHLPAELSGGEKQRVAIARALVSDAPVILADEPTAALDSASGRVIMEMLSELARSRNRAVIIVTHDSRLKLFADRILVMEDGAISPAADQVSDFAEVQS